MDVYGYAPYQQYSQSEDLAKQMYSEQAMASSMPYNREISGPHVMPAPSGIPWNMQGMTWGLQSPPHLMQFTAQNQTLDPKMTPVIHCKRKSLDVEPAVPAKQLITEEKMAAHLNSMHISSQYTPHSLAGDETMDVNMDMPSTSASALTQISEKWKDNITITLSEEVKKIKDQPLLPPAIIERLVKPRMSLVVWKPREDILEKLIDVAEEKKESEEQPKKRNGVLVTENSGMDVEM